MRILLIEDDTVLGAAVRDQIAADGQSVDWVRRLDAASINSLSICGVSQRHVKYSASCA